MEFYTYLWLREDGTPYYAGKGNGRRAFIHHNRLRPPTDQSRIVIFPMESEALALESEIALIELFGRKDSGTGILRNLTAGGEGLADPSPEIRRKMSERARGNKYSLGFKHSIETKKLWSQQRMGNQSARGHKRSAEINKLVSEKLKNRKFSLTHRARLSEANKRTKKGNKNMLGWVPSEATRRKMSESAKRRGHVRHPKT